MGVQIGGWMPSTASLQHRKFPYDLSMLTIRSAFGFCSSAGHSLVSRVEVGNRWSKRALNEVGFIRPVRFTSSLICSCRGRLFDDFNEESMKRSFEDTRIPFRRDLDDIQELRSSAWPPESVFQAETSNVNYIHRDIPPCNVPELADDGGVPSSIKTLKRQYSRKRKKNEASNKASSDSSVYKALSSLFFILKTTQSQAFEIRQLLFYDEDVRGVLATVQKEMHSSFLWLFQQIFACTPQLMISIMVLLANYTAYSVSNSVVVEATPLSSLIVSMPRGDLENRENDVCSIPDDEMINGARLSSYRTHVISTRGSFSRGSQFDPQENTIEHLGVPLSESPLIIPSNISSSDSLLRASSDHVGIEGMNCNATETNRPRITETRSNMPCNEGHLELDDSHTLRSDAFLPVDYRNKVKRLVTESKAGDENLILRSLFEEAVNEIERRSGQALHSVNLDDEIVQSMVAPVKINIEPDHYECFERTDALYRHALSLDCNNPLLLSNYAQFLYVVKHDHDRSEHFFLQAMLADPADAENINRYAGFLWLARGKLSEADRLFKAAIAADPSNTCYVASYAHFLWRIEDRGQSHAV